ncbi:MAG: D-glycero-beta-D-manno-heptose-7-phosphate kinase [Chloroflexota bacterium]
MLRTARVLVVGDIILDRYVAGSANRLSPEAPIPVLRPTRIHAVLGGAANVALNIVTLGGTATLVGIIGQDDAGAKVQSLLKAVGPRLHGCLLDDPTRPTTVKTRFIAGTHQLLRLDEEVSTSVKDGLADRIVWQIETALSDAQVLVLSDYSKGVLSDAVLKRVLACARDYKRIIIADPKRADFSAYHGVTILTPNESEARVAAGIDASTDDGAARAGARALQATSGTAVLITRSERGLTLVQRGMPTLHLPTCSREVADVSGAGDTLVAALATALAAGAALSDAAGLANVAASIAVGKHGTTTVSEQELRGALYLRKHVATDRKVVSPAEAQDQVAAWKHGALRVGFTNGCFDLVHPGHVRLLTEARAACDRLVVGLNTDASVKRLKGPDRPMQNEAARATVVASLAPVDLVVLFNEDTPIDLIGTLKPDVLMKGADYKLHEVVGADLAAAWGGTVKLIDLQKGYSTTDIIRRINTISADRMQPEPIG